MRLVEAYNNECSGISIQHLLPYIINFELEQSFSITPSATLTIDFDVSKKYDMRKVINILKEIKDLEYKGTRITNLQYQGISIDMSTNGNAMMKVAYKRSFNAEPIRFDHSILNIPSITSVNPHRHDNLFVNVDTSNVYDRITRYDNDGDSSSATRINGSISGTINLESLSIMDLLGGNNR